MSDTPNESTLGTVPSKPGIMAVASTVLNPSALDPLDFCNWYENTHIQEVQSTGGISTTQRYESLTFDDKYRQQNHGSNVPENSDFKYDLLTVYSMPDLAFRKTEAFRGLVGQSKPSDESDLLEKVFKQAEFCTRFCEKVDDGGEQDGNASPAPFIITVGVKPGLSNAGVLLSGFSKLSGYRRVTKYKIHEASVLSAFNRSYINEPSEFSVIELDSLPDLEDVPQQDVNTRDLEIGYWTLRRDYAGTERTPAQWKPKK